MDVDAQAGDKTYPPALVMDVDARAGDSISQVDMMKHIHYKELDEEPTGHLPADSMEAQLRTAKQVTVDDSLAEVSKSLLDECSQSEPLQLSVDSTNFNPVATPEKVNIFAGESTSEDIAIVHQVVEDIVDEVTNLETARKLSIEMVSSPSADDFQKTSPTGEAKRRKVNKPKDSESIVIQDGGKRTRDRPAINWSERLFELMGTTKKSNTRRVSSPGDVQTLVTELAAPETKIPRKKTLKAELLMEEKQASAPPPHSNASKNANALKSVDSKQRTKNNATTVAMSPPPSSFGKKSNVNLKRKRGEEKELSLKPDRDAPVITESKKGTKAKRSRAEDEIEVRVIASKKKNMKPSKSDAEANPGSPSALVEMKAENNQSQSPPEAAGIIMKSFVDTNFLPPPDKILPSYFENFVGLWVGLLDRLIMRVDDVTQWSLLTKTCISRALANRSGSKGSRVENEVLGLINIANHRGYRCKQRLVAHIIFTT